MTGLVDGFIRGQLLERRHKLQHAAAVPDRETRFRRLLQEVDSALARVEDGSFGVCESCHEAIEPDRLIADPLVRFCLDHLNQQERDALEQDLQLAAQVQRGLLPRQDLTWRGWNVAYHYEPAGVVSGDYCDIVDGGDAGLYFIVGDVSGKGVAASMLMAHLHAMFRTLISVGMSLQCMLEHASRVFSQSTLPAHYATLVCGRAQPDGRVEISNAGHLPPFVVRDNHVATLEGSNLPVGMFGDEEFSVQEFCLDPGHSLVLFSDGVSEASDISGTEYGSDRLRKLIGDQTMKTPSALIDACRNDLASFRGRTPKSDDVTILVLNRAAA
jgi:sigma-B regulation protein RsbU (phosphoserine phosphatase)